MKSTSSLFKLAIARNGLPRAYLGQASRSYSAQSSISSSGSTSQPSVPPPVGHQSSQKSNDSGDGQRATISKAMQAYLKRSKEHQEFMDQQEKEFVFGRRHLANMMGKDPESFTQKDIDEAIRYLFPCGLYEPRARPVMKPPMEIYPRQKSAQFDMSGRPHHPFFYTAKPNFYFLLHEMVSKLNALNKLAPSKTEMDGNENMYTGSQWITKVQLEEKLLEKITDSMYNEWMACMERIVSHPKGEKEVEFVKSYRKPLSQQTKSDDLPPVTLEPDGRKSVHVPCCMKKSARGEVLVTVPGNGNFKINGKGLDYFKLMSNRQAVISPLQLVGWLGKVDIEANVEGGTLAAEHLLEPGETSRAGALRWGIATALAALGADAEKLRLAGYLVRDHRMRERNKHAHDGARAKWTWKKR